MGIATAVKDIPTGQAITVYREDKFVYEECTYLRPMGKNRSLVTNAKDKTEQVLNVHINT